LSTLQPNLPENQETAPRTIAPAKAHRPKSVHSCNFRTAGRLSNEDARTVTELHQKVGQHVAIALDSYLGASVEVKLETFDQLTIKEHVSELSPLCYVVPLASNAIFIECDNDLVFPFIDLLMGGAGSAQSESRDLSEIEEEIMRDVVLLIARQCQDVWKMPDVPLVAGPRIKATVMQQAFSMSEKAAVVRFGIECAGVTGTFRLVLTTEFLNGLLKQMKQGVPQKKPRVLTFALPPLRERILDCDTQVTTELAGLKVTVRDLVALQAGSVLKLRAPVRNPATLTAGGRSLFEAMPVRNGSQRAAQLIRRVRTTEWIKG
jgi:flagellar motor switch protein FliM